MYFFYGIKNSKENPEIKAQLEKKQQKEKSKLLNQYNEYRQRHTSSGSSSGRTSPSKNPTNTSLLRSSLSYQSPTDFSSVDQTCLKLGQDVQDKRSPSFRRREEMDSHREVTGARMNSFYNKNQKKRSVSRKVRGPFVKYLLFDQNFALHFDRKIQPFPFHQNQLRQTPLGPRNYPNQPTNPTNIFQNLKSLFRP